MWISCDVGITKMNNPFLMVYTIHLWWLRGWFMDVYGIAIPTLIQMQLAIPWQYKQSCSTHHYLRSWMQLSGPGGPVQINENTHPKWSQTSYSNLQKNGKNQFIFILIFFNCFILLGAYMGWLGIYMACPMLLQLPATASPDGPVCPWRCSQSKAYLQGAAICIKHG